MITPRHTRLVRVPDLHSFRATVATLVGRHIETFSEAPLVIVPTQAAARHFERTVRLRGRDPKGVPASASVAPATRDEMYDAMHARLASPPRRLNAFERDALMQAAAHLPRPELPFAIRPGLVAEMVRFYDQLRRNMQSVARFEALMEEALGGGDVDRGAERLRRQTGFLAAALRRYEQAVVASGGCDEHSLRGRLVNEVAVRPVRSIIVTVADWIAEPDGLFVADFDLLARLPELQRIDLVCTDAVLGSGFHERIHGWWPGLEETSSEEIAPLPERIRPRLMTPNDAGDPWFTYRDREEEVIAVARRAAAARESNRTSLVVFKRPLPYLYLAKDILESANIAYHSADALPLAADPGVSVVDLLLESVETRFTRLTLLALLRAPLLKSPLALPATRTEVAALDRQLSARRYLGELERLEALAAVWDDEASRGALETALALVRDLSVFLAPGPASVQLRRLLAILSRWFPIEPGAVSATTHDVAVRQTLEDSLNALAAAHERYHDVEWSIDDLASAVRRAIGDQTFAPAIADPVTSVVHFADDRAARYVSCDELTLVGLTDSDWPEKPHRNIFYSAGLLKALGWPSEKDRRAAADARFIDILGSASGRVYVSTITLDDDALVNRSTELDEIPRARLSSMVAEPLPATALNAEEALLDGDLAWPDFEPASRTWFDLRRGRTPSTDAVFHGRVGAQPPRVWSVSALETYIDCPFRFFGRHVLRLEEEPDDEEVMDPRRRGQFVHEVFERFFRRWQDGGNAAITPANIDQARTLFTAVVDESLHGMSPAEAGLERTRLLGSSAAAGLGESVLRMEAERPVPVVERKLELDLRGEFTIATAAGPRTRALKGRVDRLDLLSDGTFRLIDYKLGWPPKRDRALQLPIYAVCSEQRLPRRPNGESWQLGEAMYVAFKGPRRVVPLFATDAARRDVLADAQQRLADTIDAIERGEFPPAPDDVFRCETCSFSRVCRKDYV